MSAPEVDTPNKGGWLLRLLLAAALIAACAGAVGYLRGWPGSQDGELRTHVIQRGDMQLSFITGGHAKSLAPRHIKVEIREEDVRLLHVVEEGRLITKEDVENGLILAEFDTADAEDRIMDFNLYYEQALTGFARTKQKLEIMRKENESMLQGARRQVKFKSMDLRKYLGEVLGNELMEKVRSQRRAENALENYQQDLLEEEVARKAADKAMEKALKAGVSKQAIASALRTQGAESAGDQVSARASASMAMVEGLAERYGFSEAEQSNEELAAEAVIAAQAAQTAARELKASSAEFKATAKSLGYDPEDFTGDMNEWSFSFAPIDFNALARDPRLGGSAALEREKLQTALMLDTEALLQTQKSLDGSKALFAEEFIPETQLEKERLKYERMKTELALNGEDERLFFTYDFPKEAEQATANYEEALRRLDKITRTTETRLKSAKVSFLYAQMGLYYRARSRRWSYEQFAHYRIRAEYEGLIVYGESGNQNQDWDEQIREGMSCHQGMVLFTIPDASQMAFSIRLHESEIENVRVGQQARIRVEAYPDQVLAGEVLQVDLLPSSRDNYFNPEMRVYNAVVKITGIQDWLRPGMTAVVEILVDELRDVLMAPIESVITRAGESVCYLANGERRIVETGHINDEYVEIRGGLESGDVVALNPNVFLRGIDDGTSNVDLWMPEDLRDKKQNDTGGTESAEDEV